MLKFNCKFIRKKNSPYKKELSEVRVIRQTPDHYLKDVCSITSYYGIFTIEIASPKSNLIRHQIKTDDRIQRYRILKNFTDYIKNIQHQNSQRANSMFTNDVFSIIFNYLSKLELKETQSESPTQTPRHTTVRQKICVLSKFLNRWNCFGRWNRLCLWPWLVLSFIIWFPLHFVNEEICETMPTTTQEKFPPFILHLQLQ